MMLTSRLAAGGKGGSNEDLALFLKLSNTATELMKSAGLGASLAAPIVEQRSEDDPHEKLLDHFTRIVEGQRRERAAGRFHDETGAPIRCEKRIELEKQIYALEQRRSGGTVTDDVVAVEEPPSPAACEPVLSPREAEPAVLAPSAPPPPDNVVKITHTPPPPAEKSTTQKFLDWNAAGGSERITDWSPAPHWRGW